MKDYLLLFRGGDILNNETSPEELQAHMQKWMHWMDGLQQQGKLSGGQPLSPEGKQITGNKKTVTDGPFIEGKEYVGGYLMIKAEDLNAATELSKGCPILEFEDGKVEIREIMELMV